MNIDELDRQEEEFRREVEQRVDRWPGLRERLRKPCKPWRPKNEG